MIDCKGKRRFINGHQPKLDRISKKLKKKKNTKMPTYWAMKY